jgi:hypothetical protein
MRSAETESNEINVSVRFFKITLSDNVNFYAEMEDARLAAWSAPEVSRWKIISSLRRE